MFIQNNGYTLTEDTKILIQYVKEQVFDPSIIGAAERLDTAIEKGLSDYYIPYTLNKEK